MITSRVSKRPGYGVNRGATNPKLTIGDVAPLNPQKNDVWMDMLRGNVSVYSGSAWVTYRMVFESATEPVNTNILWYDTSV
jgi:hypothetical protein